MVSDGPSPTGFVHLGNLVQGLTSERMSHQSGGVLFLRVEDTDAKREVPGAVEVLINTPEALRHPLWTKGPPWTGIPAITALPPAPAGGYLPCLRQAAGPGGQGLPLLLHRGRTDRHAGAAGGQQGDNRLLRKICHLAGPASGGRAGGPGGGKPWVLRFRSTGDGERQFKFDDLVKGQADRYGEQCGPCAAEVRRHPHLSLRPRRG